MKKEISEQEYKEAILNSFSIADVCRYFGLGLYGANYRKIHKAIEKYNLNTEHFLGSRWNCLNTVKKTNILNLDNILVENSTFDNTNNLKKYLIREGYKEHRCERCKRTEWEGQEIPLELHHINGKRSDNRIENLQILCPNCHALTENYCGKKVKINIIEKREEYLKKYCNELYNKLIISSNKKEKIIRKQPLKKCIRCGKEFKGRKNAKFCSRECMIEYKTKRPSLEELKSKYAEFNGNKTKIGHFYGVSDNAVKKWLKFYKNA